jgi:hypothetical protein
MKRLFVGLTLLLMAFLSTLDTLDGLHALLARISVPRWGTELALAVTAVAAFVRASDLNRRLLFPRRGLRLLAAGIAVYGLAVAASAGLVAQALVTVPLEPDNPVAAVTGFLAGLHVQPLFVAAQVLLVLGVFRALANLVPPAEFAEDF